MAHTSRCANGMIVVPGLLITLVDLFAQVCSDCTGWQESEGEPSSGHEPHRLIVRSIEMGVIYRTIQCLKTVYGALMDGPTCPPRLTPRASSMEWSVCNVSGQTPSPYPTPALDQAQAACDPSGRPCQRR